MLRRSSAVVLTVLVGVVAVAATAGAASPADGPRLAFLRLSHDPTRYELATVSPGGKDYRQVLRLELPRGRRYVPFDSPAWSPDGALLAFKPVARKPSSLFVVGSDGNGLRPVLGTHGGSLPIFSPDGRTLAFSRFRREELDEHRDGRTAHTHLEFESTSIWTVDLLSGELRQLTPWRDGLDQLATSYSPDGSTLLVMRIDERRTGEPEVVVLPASGGRPKLLVSEGALPVYSPDGSKIALFRERQYRVGVERTPIGTQWHTEEDFDLYVIDSDGSRLRRLTKTRGVDEFFANWDPSGQRLAYMRLGPGNSESASAGFGDSIMQINADGTCEREVLSIRHAALYGPAWQPGPSREAGRIEC